jgi:hypothetical protein
MAETYTDTFRRIVEEEKAIVIAESEKKRAAREAARKRLNESLRVAQDVRDRIVHAMFAAMHDCFVEGKLSVDCEFRPSNANDEFSLVLVVLHKGHMHDRDRDELLPSGDVNAHLSWKKFPIKASVSVLDGGSTLHMLVAVPKVIHGSELISSTRDLRVDNNDHFDEAEIVRWFQEQLEDCTKKCVRLAVEAD